MWNTSSLFRVKSQNTSNSPFLCVNLSAFPKPFFELLNLKHTPPHSYSIFVYSHNILLLLLVSFRPNMSNKYKPSGTMSHIFQMKIRFHQANTFASINICLFATEITAYARMRERERNNPEWNGKKTDFDTNISLRANYAKRTCFRKTFFFFFISRISSLWNLHDSWNRRFFSENTISDTFRYFKCFLKWLFFRPSIRFIAISEFIIKQKTCKSNA